jgi:multiple sugar transport system permease protein
MFINNDVFRQAGLVDAKGNVTPPKNWDELRADGKKLTIFRTPGDPKSGIVRLGFAPNAGNSWLYLYAWEAGGEFMNPERTRVTLDSPPNIRALHYMADCYDDIGGVGQAESFQQAQQSGAQDPFILGLLAMKTDVTEDMGAIADWKPDMDFQIIPSPMPQDQIDAGKPPVAWSGGFSLVIPKTARQREGAFKLIQFISSDRGRAIMELGSREKRESEGRLYLPGGIANRRQYEKSVADAITNNPRIPQTFKAAYKVVQNLMPLTRIRPVTPIGQLLWNQQLLAYDGGVRHQYANEAKQTGKDEMQIAMQVNQVEAQRQLDAILHPPLAPEVRWTRYIFAYCLLLIVPFVLIWIRYKRTRHEMGYRPGEVAAGLFFASPWIFGFALFVGGPVLFSIVFSFTRYDILSPAGYVGLANYKALFADPTFYKSLFNTVYMIIGIPLSMIVSLAIALMLNRAIRGIGFYRAMYYLPAIAPVVAVSLMWIWIFNPSYGLINGALAWLFSLPPSHWIEHGISHFTTQPFQFTLPLWLQDANWSKPSLILMKLWAAGGGMIIWLAGLQSIPSELYEAANIDGASKWRRFLHVTIPMLSPYILFNIIIGLIGTMQMFSEAYIMTPDGMPAQSTLVYAYYLFKCAFQYFRMGYASALAWILFILVMILTLIQLWLSKKWVHYEQA